MRHWLIFLLFFITTSAIATTNQPLTVDKAFQFSAENTASDKIIAHWKIAPGYHLYRERMKFSLVDETHGSLGKVDLPEGIAEQDNILGKYQVYRNSVDVIIPINHLTKGQQNSLIVSYQGCADSGFCYPPVKQKVAMHFSDTPGNPATNVAESVAPTATPVTSEQDRVSQLLINKSLWISIISFFGFGLLLSFTPCILPMIPILSGIIVGQGKDISTGKAFWLSSIYVLSMSFTYAIAGILAALAGSHLQASLQSPWVIGVFSGLFVLMALSLFGYFELRLPSKFQDSVTRISNSQTSGTYLGVAIMGCLATLIVSPCVTAPLVGALSFISQTGNALLGATALFSMGLGMGLPLIVIGTFGGKLLPKAGAWMNTVKNIFGVMMLGVAIAMVGRILPGQITLLLWAALLVGCSIFIGTFTPTASNTRQTISKVVGVMFLMYGIILTVDAVNGNDNPLTPFTTAETSSHQTPKSETAFTPIKNTSELNQRLTAANHQGKITLLDVYADWCVSCKEMDATTFSNSKVQTALKKLVMLRADITVADATENKVLLKRFGIIAPPTILFFDKDGKELTQYRIVGEMKPDKFFEHLQTVLANT